MSSFWGRCADWYRKIPPTRRWGLLAAIVIVGFRSAAGASSTQIFQDLNISSTGVMTGSAGDSFIMSPGGVLTNAGSFTNGGSLTAGVVNNSGSFSQSGSATFSGDFTNTGTATIGGTQSWSAGTHLVNNAGSVTLSSDAGASGATLSVAANGGTVTFAASQHLAALSAGAGGTAAIAPGGGKRVTTNSLTLGGTPNAWAGRIDVADDSMIVNYSGASPAGTIASQLKEGFGATGHWDGPAGITSSAAHNDFSHFSIGYADGADHVVANLAAGQVLIQYARAGDANLDGIVNVVDLGILATHYGHSGTWDQGDYNYDGVVNVVDLGILATNYGHGTSLTASQAAVQFQADMQLFPQLTSQTPEPSSMAIMALATGLLLRRRWNVPPW